MKVKYGNISLSVIFCAGLALRSIISLYPYSGFKNENSDNKTDLMHGDFEAQRHWQEITVNLPINDWYQNTSDNDLLYWGLDYPPLTAYHSYIIGIVAKKLNSSYVELHKSRRLTDESHKQFMRLTVLVMDLLLYIPAILVASQSIYEKVLNKKVSNILINKDQYLLMICSVAVFYPGQILIDNGHFQYNNVSLGFTALAVAALLYDKTLIGSLLFVLAVNYKQMELYHSLPFFFYLLVGSFRDPDSGNFYNLKKSIGNLLRIGIIVIFTFALIWSPWLTGGRDIVAVLKRIFPIDRGVFEDKVSNIWCIVNVFYKIKENIPNPEMAKICVICTVLASVPSILALSWRSTKTIFLYSLFNVSLSFFLFSFQVHEKTILIPALSAIFLFPLEPFMAFWFLQISTFSMLPLLHKDQLTLAFIGLSGAYFIFTKILLSENTLGKNDSFLEKLLFIGKREKTFNFLERTLVPLFYLSMLGQIVLTILFLFVKPPTHLPFLFPLFISAYSCCHFVMFYLYFNIKQVTQKTDKIKTK